MLIRVWGGREKVSMADRQAGYLYGEEYDITDVSRQRHTLRQQPSAHVHADNENEALAAKTHMGRKDSMK